MIPNAENDPCFPVSKNIEKPEKESCSPDSEFESEITACEPPLSGPAPVVEPCLGEPTKPPTPAILIKKANASDQVAVDVGLFGGDYAAGIIEEAAQDVGLSGGSYDLPDFAEADGGSDLSAIGAGFIDGQFEPAIFDYGISLTGFQSGVYLDSGVFVSAGEQGSCSSGFLSGSYIAVNFTVNASDNAFEAVGFLNGAYTLKVNQDSETETASESSAFLSGAYVLKVLDTSQSEQSAQSAGFSSGSYNVV